MISFIIIGKNEEKNIYRTIESIKKKVVDREYEIIYVDSNSIDNTIGVAKSFNNVKIYKIKSNIYSASLGRNIGYEKSSGEYLFFLDADMEIEYMNLDYIISELENEEVGVISGKLIDYIYDNNDKILRVKEDRYKVESIKETLVEPGGYFFIRKKLFERVGGFDNKIKCHEELDLFCRILIENKILIRTNKLIVNHHNYKTTNTNRKVEYCKFTNGFYSGIWFTLFKNIKIRNIKNYFKFKSVLKSWINRLIIIGVIFTFILSILSCKIIIMSIIIILNLIYTKFNFKKIVNVYSLELYILLSIFYIVNNKEVKYIVNEI